MWGAGGRRTVVVDDRDLLDGLLADDGELGGALVERVERDLHEEDLVRLPLVVVDDLDVDVLQYLVLLEYQHLLHRHVVGVGGRRPVHRLEPMDHRPSTGQTTVHLVRPQADRSDHRPSGQTIGQPVRPYAN